MSIKSKETVQRIGRKRKQTEEGTVIIKATVTGEDNLIRPSSKKMRRLKCEEELAKIIMRVGHEQGFELDTMQIPFLVTAISSWIDKRFGLDKDPILRRIKASQV